jgi:hypothetical protein
MCVQVTIQIADRKLYLIAFTSNVLHSKHVVEIQLGAMGENK